ncbi:hypothetical protein ACHHYP_15739 [Achlya hypogyna]|uniref:Uncharacterized protein n=1 Tax=Achlya hypogyna TaxID=1202772 RepID=A0A1V9YA93_ACHHY|nr:hypothetical protein ACHHYP_15739 [Achlya hypogyna]
MGDTSRGRRTPNARPARGQGHGGNGYNSHHSNHTAIAGTGIKSGMTVEDLKRLTQKRMQDATAGLAAVIPGEVITPKAKPSIAVPVVPPPFVPKTGMTVQELKQLTTLRLAQQNAGTPTHQGQPLNGAIPYYARNVTSTPTSSPGGTPKRQNNRSSFSATVDTPKKMAPPAQRNGAKRLPEGYTNGGHSPNQPPPVYTPAPAPQYDHLYHVQPVGGSAPLAHEYAPPTTRQQMQFEDDSFPPPPPTDDSGSFLSSAAMPSWSPPPTRAKTIDARPVSLYGQAAYSQTSFGQSNGLYVQPMSATSDDETPSFLAPPPGLTRRPSMTVPWQVAESVLHTPQQPSTRKQMDSKAKETSLNQFASQKLAQSPPRMPLHRSTSSAAAAAAAELNMTGLVRQKSNDGPPSLGRRGSFGNAAQMFKFRRRSKSRLDVARDIALMEMNEHERMLSIEENKTRSNSDDLGSLDDVQPYTPEMADQDFLPMYNQRSVPRLNIPPPPPPPMDDSSDDEYPSSPSRLPMMSPNGAKLRKVAQLARSGNLSNEDKTRAKDEIIQNSLGLGALSMLHDEPKKSPSARGIARSKVPLEERLAQAAQRVSDCVAKGDMVEFNKAMADLDKLRLEANQLMQQ